MRVVVNTPNGNIGRQLCPKLLDLGAELSIITRTPEKTRSLAQRGARVVVGSFDEPAVLDEAFDGADTLFWLPPLAPEQADFLAWARQTGTRAAAAAQRHGIRRAVLLSSVGAQHDHGVGPIACMPAIESAFSACIPHLRILRAGHFMENFIPHLPSIMLHGLIVTPHPGDLPMPMVATRDIAEVVAGLCLDRAWAGHDVQGVHGPCDISHDEAAAAIARGIGRPVAHQRCTEEQACRAMANAGLPLPIARLVAELYEGVAQGRVRPAEPRTAASTTPTHFETFVRDVLAPRASLMASNA